LEGEVAVPGYLKKAKDVAQKDTEGMGASLDDLRRVEKGREEQRLPVSLQAVPRREGDEGPMIQVRGRGSRKGATNVVVPIPEQLLAELTPSGNVAQALIGLALWGLDVLSRDGKTLVVDCTKQP